MSLYRGVSRRISFRYLMTLSGSLFSNGRPGSGPSICNLGSAYSGHFRSRCSICLLLLFVYCCYLFTSTSDTVSLHQVRFYMLQLGSALELAIFQTRVGGWWFHRIWLNHSFSASTFCYQLFSCISHQCYSLHSSICF